MKIKKFFKSMILLAFMFCLFMQSINVEASIAGYSYSFQLLAKGQGSPGISGNATKHTYYSYAQVNVLEYSNPGYYTRAYTTGAARSYDQSFCSTGHYSISYQSNDDNFYHYGETFNLNMLTASNNSYGEKVKGNWTP